MNDDMIPVFIPRDLGMRALYGFAAQQGCKLIVSNSGAIVLEPIKHPQSGTPLRFITRPSTAPELAPEVG